MKTYEGTVKLYSQKNMILGHEVSDYEPTAKDITQLGFFDTAAPNYVAFNPQVKPENFTPKPEDFIHPTFRLLSKVVIPRMYNPIDFSEGDVLKDSMHLLVGQTLFPDHEPAVGNAFGVIEEVFWQESFKFNGKTIPAGVNGKLKIDGVANPKIARLILMRPPGIHSSSVTVNFEWKQSHDMSRDEFYSKLGTYNDKGELIRKVVTKIGKYYENSLVPHGADVFAKQLDKNGKPLAHSMLPETIKNGLVGSINYAAFQSAEAFAEEQSFNLNIQSDMNKNLLNLTALAVGLQSMATLASVDISGISLEEISQEDFQKKVMEPIIAGLPKELPSISDSFKKLMTERPELTLESVTALEENQRTEEDAAALASTAEYQALGTVEELTALQAAEATRIADIRTEVINNLKLISGPDGPDETLVGVLEKSSVVELQAFNKTYLETLEAKFPMKCTNCGGTEVSRKSSETTPEKVSNTEEKIRKSKSRKPSEMHK